MKALLLCSVVSLAQCFLAAPAAAQESSPGGLTRELLDGLPFGEAPAPPNPLRDLSDEGSGGDTNDIRDRREHGQCGETSRGQPAGPGDPGTANSDRYAARSVDRGSEGRGADEQRR